MYVQSFSFKSELKNVGHLFEILLKQKMQYFHNLLMRTALTSITKDHSKMLKYPSTVLTESCQSLTESPFTQSCHHHRHYSEKFMYRFKKSIFSNQDFDSLANI